MKSLFIYVGIFISLIVSRLIPHPPNFTNLLALSFYVPIFFGFRMIPALMLSFVITDFIIGYHQYTHWTWGSIFLICFVSPIFSKNIKFRVIGLMLTSIIFFIITNFGVWASGVYGFTLNGLITCYILAIPFYISTLASTMFYSLFIEIIYFYCRNKNLFLKIK